MKFETADNNTIKEITQGSVEQRAERLCRLLKKAATAWLEIAKEVQDAKRALNSSDYSEFLRRGSLSVTVADKLMRIAHSGILHSDESKPYLNRTDGWTNLYEVAKLPEANVREMYRELRKNPEQRLTRSFIQQFKSSHNASQNSALTIVTITLSEDDVKRLDYDEYLRFRDDLDAIQRIVDRSIIAASMTLHTKSLEKVESIILQQSTCDADDTTQEHSEFIELRALPAADTDCSDIPTQTH